MAKGKKKRAAGQLKVIVGGAGEAPRAVLPGKAPPSKRSAPSVGVSAAASPKSGPPNVRRAQTNVPQRDESDTSDDDAPVASARPAKKTIGLDAIPRPWIFAFVVAVVAIAAWFFWIKPLQDAAPNPAVPASAPTPTVVPSSISFPSANATTVVTPPSTATPSSAPSSTSTTSTNPSATNPPAPPSTIVPSTTIAPSTAVSSAPTLTAPTATTKAAAATTTTPLGTTAPPPSAPKPIAPPPPKPPAPTADEYQ